MRPLSIIAFEAMAILQDLLKGGHKPIADLPFWDGYDQYADTWSADQSIAMRVSHAGTMFTVYVEGSEETPCWVHQIQSFGPRSTLEEFRDMYLRPSMAIMANMLRKEQPQQERCFVGTLSVVLRKEQ